jgi:uncharacterized membrane protein YgcG
MHRRGRTAALGVVAAAAWVLLLVAGVAAATAAPAAGPPYPPAVDGQRVYDYAGIFSSGEIARAEAEIRTIETRTGAQVAVYTQIKPESDTLDLANADALALMNQWGVGRKGFDDGLVILFDMQDNRQHGEVSLYAGSGFMAAYLTNADRQAIFDNDMKPLLTQADFDGALAAALKDVDSAATPEHAAELSRARILNAAVGVAVLVLAVTMILFVLSSWYNKGRDPTYVDNNSILMPAPPEGLTPAMATLLMDDRTSSRTVSAGMVDLAAQGLLQFRQDSEFLGKKKTNIGIARQGAQPQPPEGDIYAVVATFADADGFVPTHRASGLLAGVGKFKSDLETLAVQKGWLTGRPTRVVGLWIVVAVFEGVAAIPLFIWTFALDASGGFLGGGALVVAAVVTGITAWFMPCRTRLGAMLVAMLAAYKRTLQLTMAQSGSMDEVIQRKALPWVATPDAAMAWGVAFGLNADIETLLRRTVDSSVAAGRQVGWYPAWFFGPGSGGGLGFAAGSGAGGGGLFSAGSIPDIGSMLSSLGSIGSSSGGGGGFGGGGGGGGGGAGGGF